MAGKQPRKTIMVESVKEGVNRLLSLNDQWTTQEQKKGACHVLESILHDTGNYNGYMYPDFPHELQPLDAVGKKAWFDKHEYDRRYF